MFVFSFLINYLNFNKLICWPLLVFLAQEMLKKDASLQPPGAGHTHICHLSAPGP